jgi:hypothetical protein
LRLPRSRRRLLTAVVLVLALFLARPGVQSLRAKIVRSISLALGRQVEVSHVRLRLLPQPGFDLENFVVHDDPSFSAEPLLRADDVTASLRLISLLRGKLEIARLSLSEPSLNLVHNPDGRWNVEDLVERAAKIPVAPTGKARTERRPGFPYIEAGRGRINFKFGQEKKPYALTEADFALWQDSENVWSVRLKAQPVRADFNLSDTGVLKLSGSWYRAPSLRQTPLQFSLHWDRAQLGQASKLAYGKDQGWRGSLAVALLLTGTPAALNVNTDFSVQDFRRYDVSGGNSLRLAAHCAAHYSSIDHALSDLNCRAPVGNGLISIRGNVAALAGNRTYDLALAAQDVPMQSLLAFARHTKKDLPADLDARGTVDANVSVLHEPGSDRSTWTGGGEALGCTLASETTKTQFDVDRIGFRVSDGGDLPTRSAQRHLAPPADDSAAPRLEIGPFNVALDRPEPATVRGWISRSGYNLTLAGDAQVRTLLQLARTLGLPAAQLRADGAAKVDLQLAGMWSGLASPRFTGQAQLHSVRAGLRGVSEPLEIASANLLFSQDEIRVQSLAASLAGSTWRGSLSLPRPCASLDACPVQFDIHTNELSASRLVGLLSAPSRRKPWYRFLSSTAPEEDFFTALRASGKLTAKTVVMPRLVADKVSTDVELDRGRLQLTGLHAETLGGYHLGEWSADFSVKPPVYRGTGTLQRVSLAQLAALMNDGWITGTADGTYRIRASGLNASELFSSATGTLDFDARDGVLPHVALASGGGPLHINRFQGRFVLRDGSLEIQQGKLETPGSIYRLSGTASLSSALDIKLFRDGARGFKISGTLAEPHVEPAAAPETRAALKP